MYSNPEVISLVHANRKGEPVNNSDSRNDTNAQPENISYIKLSATTLVTGLNAEHILKGPNDQNPDPYAVVNLLRNKNPNMIMMSHININNIRSKHDYTQI